MLAAPLRDGERDPSRRLLSAAVGVPAALAASWPQVALATTPGPSDLRPDRPGSSRPFGSLAGQAGEPSSAASRRPVGAGDSAAHDQPRPP